MPKGQLIDTTGKTVGFEWDRGFTVQLQEVPLQKRREIFARTERTTFVKHEKKVDQDLERAAEMLLAAAIVSWQGLTYESLLEICKPFRPAAGVKLTDEIPFNDEEKAFICANANEKFHSFVLQGVDQIATVIAGEQRREMENLSHSSGGN